MPIVGKSILPSLHIGNCELCKLLLLVMAAMAVAVAAVVMVAMVVVGGYKISV